MFDALDTPGASRSILDHFGLREAPFRLPPDPRFASTTDSRRPVLEEVVAAVECRERLILVTGEEGSGKSTLCLALPPQLSAKVIVSMIRSVPQTPAELLDHMLTDFGLGVSSDPMAASRGQADRYSALQGFLVSLVTIEAHVVVVIDDAERLPMPVWNEILRLSNFDANHPGLLQIVLFGLPVLEDLINQPALAGLARRVVRTHRLPRLTDAEVRQHVDRQLWVARGGIGALALPSSQTDAPVVAQRNGLRPRFTRIAIGVISRCSSGNLRTINLICDRALTLACDLRRDRIGGALAMRAAVELGSGRSLARVWRLSPRLAALIVAMLTTSGLLAAALLDGEESRSAAVEPVAVSSLSPDQPFPAVRTDALLRAGEMSIEPDVRGLLKLQDEVNVWNRQTNFASRAAVEELLVELQRLTDDARRRQLDRDRELILDEPGPATR